MKSIRFWVLVFIFSLCLFFFTLNASGELLFPNPEQTISMDFQDASLKDILKIFSIQSGLNFIASQAVQDRKITLYLDKVSVKEAMDKLFRANNLSYELDRGSDIFIVKDWGRPQVETVTRVFYLKYATVSSSSLKEEMANQIRATETTTTGTTGAGTAGGARGGGAGGGEGKWKIEENTGITSTVQELLSEYGSVIEDFRTNSLIVTDIPSRMAVITQVIASLDVSVSQVMLEVEMLDVSKNIVDKIGIKFGSTDASNIFTMVFKGAKATTVFPLDSLSGSGGKAVSKTFTPGSLDFGTGSGYTVVLDFLRSQSDTKYLARPRILTLNNETAEIKITTQEAVGEKKSISGQTGAQTTTTEAERYETGVSLRVTPQINSDTGEITMFIMPTVAEASASSITSSTGVKFFNPEVRSTKSVVRMKDGETVIVGGLIRNELSQTITKLPILGDIPILGGLFRHKNKEKARERELLVFITPHIVKDTKLELAQAKKMTPLPQREQNTVSAVNRQALINSSLNNVEKQKPLRH